MRRGSSNDVEFLGETGFEHVAQDEFDLAPQAQFRDPVQSDGNHLLGQVDARHPGPSDLGQMKRGAADAAAHIEHPSALPVAVGTQPPAEVVGGFRPSRADIMFTEKSSRTSGSRCDCIALCCRTWVWEPVPLLAVTLQVHQVKNRDATRLLACRSRPRLRGWEATCAWRV